VNIKGREVRSVSCIIDVSLRKVEAEIRSEVFPPRSGP
jgi:hypothetical protein